MSKAVLALSCALCLFYPTTVSAWGYQGHKVVGSIADQLLKPDAKQQVRQILGFDLRTAGPWLAKGGARLAEILNAIWP